MKKVYDCLIVTDVTNYFDSIQYSRIAEALADYIRCTSSALETYEFFVKVREHKENVYPDVSLSLLEALLRVEAAPAAAKLISDYCLKLIRQTTQVSPESHVIPLLLLRFGSSPLRNRLLAMARPKDVGLRRAFVRSALLVFAGSGRRSAERVRRLAEKSLDPEFGLIVRFVDKLQSIKTIPKRFLPRLEPRWDSVGRSKFVDTRSLVVIRLLRLNQRKAVQDWIDQQVVRVRKQPVSAFDSALIARLGRRRNS